MSLHLDRSTWKRVRLGEVIRRSRTQVDPVSSGVERYVAGGHVDSDGVAIERWGQVGDGQMGSTFRYVFQPGQVLFVSARPYLRKVGVPDFSGVVADKTYVLDAIPENGLLQEFLPFVLSSEAFVEYAIAEATGSMNPRLLWGPMQRYEFDVPPLDEQKRLADLLWAVERVTQAQREQLSASVALVDHWMVGQALAGEHRLKLGELLAHSVGGVWGKEPEHEGIRAVVVRGTDISLDGKIAWAAAPARSLTESELGSRRLRKGDVLIEKSGGSPDQPVGKIGLVRTVEHSAVPSNFVLLARANADICLPEYLFILLRGMWRGGRFARVTGRTTNIANLRVGELFGTEISLPGRDAQARAVEALGTMSEAVASASASLESANVVKAVLLGEIFGGAR